MCIFIYDDMGASYLQIEASEQLFTLFLMHPVLALVRLTGCEVSAATVAELSSVVDTALDDLRCSVAPPAAAAAGPAADARRSGSQDSQLQTESDQPWRGVLHDPFGSRLILRFALLRGFLRGLQGVSMATLDIQGWPRALPELPEELAENAERVHRHAAALLDTCWRARPKPWPVDGATTLSAGVK